MKTLKLYRGLSSTEFHFVNQDASRENKMTWHSIVSRRMKGDFEYPQDLDREISDLHKSMRLEYQYFTDSKSVAESYARDAGGIVVEVTVPQGDVLRYFDLEFQNFGRRKKKFEIVYRVRGTVLANNRKRWKLATHTPPE